MKPFVVILAVACVLSGCQSFLDVKPDAKLTVPSSLEDLQSLMNNTSIFIGQTNAGEISADDFYITDADLNSLISAHHPRIYTWEKDNLFGNESIDWSVFGQAIYYCNSIFEHLNRLPPQDKNTTRYNYLEGAAKLHRARQLFQASLVWTLVYNENSADADLGLPLRTGTDFNIVSKRATVRQTFDFLINDIKESTRLLPERPEHLIFPSKPAAYGLLARVYLYMGDYQSALVYADSCLMIKNELMDYNDLDASTTYPIPAYNEEVIWAYEMSPDQILNLARAKISPDLIEMYEDGDLRKSIFFSNNVDGTHGFKGRYTGGQYLFGGIATDEMYLIRAECNARLGNMDASRMDMVSLLSKRYRKMDGTPLYKPISEAQSEEFLQVVLDERRKELVFRGLRWYDLKRLNRDGANIMLERVVDGQIYTLPPNDLRYALPFPDDIVKMSEMLQNLR